MPKDSSLGPALSTRTFCESSPASPQVLNTPQEKKRTWKRKLNVDTDLQTMISKKQRVTVGDLFYAPRGQSAEKKEEQSLLSERHVLSPTTRMLEASGILDGTARPDGLVSWPALDPEGCQPTSPVYSPVPEGFVPTSPDHPPSRRDFPGSE